MLAAMHGDEKFATFIGNVNALVEQQRSELETRATNDSRKEDKDVIRFVRMEHCAHNYFILL